MEEYVKIILDFNVKADAVAEEYKKKICEKTGIPFAHLEENIMGYKSN